VSNYSIKVAAFTCNTSGTRQNITPSGGPGTNPKAAIFMVSGATALDTVTTQARISLGMTDGTTHLVNAIAMESGVTTSTADTGIRADNTMVISICLPTSGSTAEALDGEASFVAWTNDGVAIDWADFPATALRGHAIFFYGSDLSADVVTFVPSTTQNSSASITGLSFQPTALIAFSGWLDHSDGGSAATGRLSVGAATNYGGAIQQACRSTFHQDRGTGTSSIHRSNALLSRVAAASESSYLDVTSFNSDGATITTRGGSTGNPCAILALSLGGGRARVVTPVVATSSTGQKYIETIGFKPNAAFFWGGEAVASNSFVTTEDPSLFFGAAASTSETCSEGYTARNGGSAGNSQTYSLASSTGPIGLPIRGGGTAYAATLTAFTHNGVNINVVDSDPSDHLISILAFEETDARIGADTERISDAQVLLVTINRSVSTDTEALVDEFVMRSTDRRVSNDTEELSDAFRLVVTSDRRISSDTEELADAFRLVVTSDFRSLSETEQVADATLFVVTSDRRISADTEQLTDAFNFIVGKYLVASDTVEIGDGFVLVSSGATFLISNDTERISDQAVLLAAEAGDLIFSATDTVRISESVLMITGQVLVTGDLEEISDVFSSGRGLIARKAIKRGRVF
jgi:hypothetical protein